MSRHPERAAGVREGAAALQLTAALLVGPLALPQLVPLCTTLFRRGFESCAAFGMLLLLMVWSVLVGVALVLGAERNAFLDLPADPPRALPSGLPGPRTSPRWV